MYDLAALNPEEQSMYGYIDDDFILKVLYDTSSHEDWLKARKTGIGGSDVGALMGLNPYSSALSVYKSKQPEYESVENTNMRKGTDLESLVFQKYVVPEYQERGFSVYKPNIIFARSKTPWLHSNLDGLAFNSKTGEHEVVEIKFVTEYGEAAWNHSEYSGIPAYYYAQVQSYMWTVGAKTAVVYALFDRTWEVQRYSVSRNEFFIMEMLDAAHTFYKENMCMHVPPRPSLATEREDFAEAMKAFAEDPELDTSKEDDPEMSKLCDEVLVTKQGIKTLEDKLTMLTERLGELALDGKHCSRFCTKPYSTSRIDVELLRELYPEAALRCTKRTNSVRTIIK